MLILPEFKEKAVIALDLGQNLGYAIKDINDKVLFNSVDLKRHYKCKDTNLLPHLFGQFLRELCLTHDIQFMFYEKITFKIGSDNYNVAQKLGGYTHACHGIAHELDIKLYPQPLGRIRSTIVGNMRAKKDTVLPRLRQMGYAIENHDAGDALACLITGLGRGEYINQRALINKLKKEAAKIRKNNKKK